MAKKAYIGVLTDIPIYTEETKTISITANNIADYFTVVNGSYYFVGSGDTFTSNNGGVNNSTATTTLTAMMDMDAISFNYSYSSEANYDKFTLAVAGTTVESAVSGATTSKSYSGSLSAGDTISFTYAKNSSQQANNDQCTFSGMRITATVKTQTGTETKSVARKIKKGYVGVKQAVSYELVSNGTRDFTDGSISVTSFSAYQINSNGTLTPNDPTTTTLDELWQYVESGANDLYFYFTGESSITECYQLYDYGLGNRTEYVYSVNVYVVTGSNFVQVARKIKKAYIGIGGIARPCWAGGELAYYGTVTALTSERCRLAATSNQNYALFGGGFIENSDGYNYLASVNTYNKQLIQTTATKLPYGTCDLAATSIGEYALFGGGYGYQTYVTAYNASLVQSLPDALSSEMNICSATSIGDYALFGGGSKDPSLVEAYNSSLVKCTIDRLSTKRYHLAATSIGDYALFGGGFDAIYSKGSNVVDAYNKALVRSTPTAFSVDNCDTGFPNAHCLSATSNSNYALFGGIGVSGEGTYKIVNAYNASLVRSVPDISSDSRGGASATSIGEYALFAGGYKYSSSTYTANSGVDAYNSNLVKSNPDGLSNGRFFSAATSIGDYALFGGGSARTGYTFYNTVDAYTLI